MGTIASQITSLTIVYSTVYSDADQRKHQSSASLAFARGNHRGPVNSPHKWSVTRKMFPCDDVIMQVLHAVGFYCSGIMTNSSGGSSDISSQWWRHHELETLSTLLALCQGNPSFSSVTFPNLENVKLIDQTKKIVKLSNHWLIALFEMAIPRGLWSVCCLRSHGNSINKWRRFAHAIFPVIGWGRTHLTYKLLNNGTRLYWVITVAPNEW